MALTVDHVIPVALAGSDDPDNLIAACIDCNAGKAAIAADSPIVEQVSELAIQLAAALELVSEARRLDVATTEVAIEQALACWFTMHGDDLPDGWYQTLERFVSLGLNGDDLQHYIEVTIYRAVTDDWRYFCGCCWKEITRRQDEARWLVES